MVPGSGYQYPDPGTSIPEPLSEDPILRYPDLGTSEWVLIDEG